MRRLSVFLACLMAGTASAKNDRLPMTLPEGHKVFDVFVAPDKLIGQKVHLIGCDIYNAHAGLAACGVINDIEQQVGTIVLNLHGTPSFDVAYTYQHCAGRSVPVDCKDIDVVGVLRRGNDYLFVSKPLIFFHEMVDLEIPKSHRKLMPPPDQ